MKRIGILSDTHGHLDQKVFHHFKDCDEIWHAGDIGTIDLADTLNKFKPLRAVWGNIDGKELRARFKEDLWFTCEKLQVLISHIGGYPPRYNARMKKLLSVQTPDLMVCGHSHILKIMKDPDRNNLIYINPGAAGIQGLHKVKTLVRLNIEGANVSNVQVIEIGKKSEIT